MKSSRTILTIFLAFLYFLILGHNLLPHTHHSQADHYQHEHSEQSLLDNLLDHHEHSSDFGDDLVDVFCPSDSDNSLLLTEQIIFIPSLVAHYCTYGNSPTASSLILEKPIYFQEHTIPIKSADSHAHTLRGPPLA